MGAGNACLRGIPCIWVFLISIAGAWLLKTRALELLQCLCPRAWLCFSVTPAVLFRRIASVKPTLLLDEVEGLNAKQKSDLAGAIIEILNAGYKTGATVPRCVGRDFKVVDFEIYCPKAFGCIGDLPRTISDRSIIIHMQKLLPKQKVERFSEHRIASEVEEFRQRIEPMMSDVANRVRGAYTALPPLTFRRDRQEEIWQPLFATLSVLDSTRMAELRRCAEVLTATKAADDEDGQTNLNYWRTFARYGRKVSSMYRAQHYWKNFADWMSRPGRSSILLSGVWRIGCDHSGFRRGRFAAGV